MSLQKWGIGSRRGDRKDRKFQRKFLHEFSPLIQTFETLPNFWSGGVLVTNFPNVPDWAARTCCLTSGKKEFESSRAFSTFFAMWFVSVIPCYTFQRKSTNNKIEYFQTKASKNFIPKVSAFYCSSTSFLVSSSSFTSETRLKLIFGIRIFIMCRLKDTQKIRRKSWHDREM